MLNLFLALLLSSFGIDKLRADEKDEEINKIQEAVARIKRFFKTIFCFIWNKISLRRQNSSSSTSSVSRQHSKSRFLYSCGKIKKKSSTLFPPSEETPISRWEYIRERAYDCVEHKYFEFFIILMIVLSSISLVPNKLFNAIYLNK